MIKRKILFLDIDGVVNCEESAKKYTWRGIIGIDPNLAFRIGKIKMYTDCEVVLSSSWRNGNEESLEYIKNQVCDFIDVTPNSSCRTRGCEIKKWIEDNIDYNNRDDLVYAILDDDTDFLLNQKNNFFKTSWKCGITEEIMEKVINHLNESE